MIIKPILPIWLVSILSLLSIYFIFKSIKEKSIDKKTFAIRLIMIVALFSISIRPMYPNGKKEILTSNIDILFVIDTTLSMSAEDYNGTNPRLDAVKDDVKEIVNEFPGARYSIIVFANGVNLLFPFIRDANVVTNSLDTLRVVSNLYADGSNLSLPVEEIKEVLISAEKKESQKQIMIYMSDGEQNGKKEIQSFSSIKEYIESGIILGYGTPKGGQMRKTDSYSTSEEIEYVDDRTTSYPYKKALSKINEDNLKDIADELNISYQHQSNLNVSELMKLESEQNDDDKDTTAYEDVYWIGAIIFIGAFLCDVSLNVRKIIY
jgi:Uncharacterized protein encoded in toxicity protection region of plasmid R478, contains von Willebrand factor (vWF) domain